MALLRKNSAAKALDLSKSGLEKLVATDPTFPKPVDFHAELTRHFHLKLTHPLA